MDVRIARASGHNAEKLVEDVCRQIGDDPVDGLIYFVNAKTDFAAVVRGLADRLKGPSIGCTTAGELCGQEGHCEDGLVATAIRGGSFTLAPALLRDAYDVKADTMSELVEPLKQACGGEPSFGLLLVDGMSMAEEQVAALLEHMLGQTPFVGGSAGDDLEFGTTYVAVNGEVATNAAAIALVNTINPIRTFHSHHFEASDNRLVVTGAVPNERRVTEINAEPAAEGYAAAIGMTVDDLTPTVFAEHPVMLRIGGEYYVRSIQKANEDGSLSFYCAIDEGLVLRVGQGKDLQREFEAEMDRLEHELGGAQLIIGFDCILRRLELLNRGQRDGLREKLIGRPLVGFSTYGEQFNGLHVNQTITGVAIGRAA